VWLASVATRLALCSLSTSCESAAYGSHTLPLQGLVSAPAPQQLVCLLGPGPGLQPSL
jgi:hypothetical protein